MQISAGSADSAYYEIRRKDAAFGKSWSVKIADGEQGKPGRKGVGWTCKGAHIYSFQHWPAKSAEPRGSVSPRGQAFGTM